MRLFPQPGSLNTAAGRTAILQPQFGGAGTPPVVTVGGSPEPSRSTGTRRGPDPIKSTGNKR